MTSSIQELREAVLIIHDMTHDGDALNALGRVRRAADSIGSKLSVSNSLLSQSWENVSDTLVKVDTAFAETLRGLLNDLYKFIRTAEENEQMLANVLEKTASLSENILNKLSITE